MSRIPILIVLAVVAMALCPAFAGSPRPHGATRVTQARPPHAKPQIPILAWIGPPASETTVERYRKLAAAGFTDSFSSFPNAESMAAALEVGRQTGVRLFVSIPELATDPEGTARRFRDHPALAGYHLRDEPSAGDFPALATWTRRIQSVDREHGCYINLFPTYANAEQLGTPTYGEHVDRFLAEVPVPYLSYDHYPIAGDRLRGDYYENLEIIAAKARAARKPFWAFALAVAHDPYPVPTLAHLRLQVFSDLAYGAQCVQYFTYWTPQSTQWNFHEGPIDAAGQRTRVYDRVKQVNREIRGLSEVFLGCRVLQVAHTGPLPSGTRAYAPEAPVQFVETRDGGAVVSQVENGGRRYLVVVNRDFRAPVPLRVAFDGFRPVTEVRKDGSLAAVRGSRVERDLGPGDIAVFRWR
jgi:hypothetical protein